MSEVIRNILDLSAKKAKDFFLDNESYSNIDLPKYFEFGKLLKAIDKKIAGKNLSDFKNTA